MTKMYRVGGERFYALDDASLEIYPGELVAIVGRRSSGKSTLLHILGCLQRADSGQLSIDGLDVSRMEDDQLAAVRSRKVGFIFQAFNLLPNESVSRNVEVPLRHQGMGAWDRQEKAEEALQLVGLGSRLQHKPGQLSAEQPPVHGHCPRAGPRAVSDLRR